MNNVKNFITKHNFICELSIVEHLILWISTFCNLSFFIINFFLPNNLDKIFDWKVWLAFFASILSIFSVVSGVKQKILCPFLGIIASIILFFISFFQQLYGTVIMYGINTFVQLITLIVWTKKSKNKISIQPKHANLLACIIYFFIFTCLTIVFTYILGLKNFYTFFGFDNNNIQTLPIRIFDSANLIFTIACFYPLIKRYDQVWYTYIFVSSSAIIVWALKIKQNNLFIPTTMIVSSTCMLLFDFIGLFNWKKTLKTNN